jgi:hypothetical protein
MAHIAIPLPLGNGKQEVEIEVTVNGEKRQLHYRVELFYWSDCHLPSIDRVECIRHIVSDYDQDWNLYYIGSPNDEFIPITFVKKNQVELV